MSEDTLVVDVLRRSASVWAPPPDYTISEWADAERFLSAEAASEPGRWDTARAPYQREIMDAIATYEEVVVMSSAQVGKTEVLLNTIGFYIHQDPSPILLVQPTLDLAEAFSKDRLAPMVRDTPALRGKIADPRSRDSGNTLLHKKFPGGHITMAGANSAASLASRPIRIVLCDEVDRYPISAGSEGDPVSLARKRTNTFWNKRIVLTSTPTIAGISRIEAAYKRSDGRRLHVPCPHCGDFHTLRWANVVFEHDDPATAVMVCPKCGGTITDRDKPAMLDAARWVAERPEITDIAGFHLNELYSPWRRFSDVVREFLAAKDFPEKLKTWVNTALGEPWEDREGDSIDASALEARRGTWNRENLPEDTVLVTAGVDTQDDRLEATFVAWGTERRLRVVSHHLLEGSPGEPEVWAKLDTLLAEAMTTQDGRTLSLAAACVDAGGHYASSVLEFCQALRFRKIWAIRGRPGPQPIWPKRFSRSAKHSGKTQWMIGVDTAKDWLRSSFAVQSENLPHHVSFSGDESLDERYFKQLTAERRVIKHDRAGRPVRTWIAPPGARVEGWDCLVYATAALEGLREMWKIKIMPPPRSTLQPAASRVAPKPNAPKPAPGAVAPPPSRANPALRSGGGVGRASWSGRL